MKKKGAILIALGVLGGIFILTFDIIAGKLVNDISGPKSISALAACAIFIITGVIFLLKNSKNKFKK